MLVKWLAELTNKILASESHWSV